MLPNRINYNFPFFDNIKFNYEKFLLAHVFIARNFSYFFTVNLVLDYSNIKLLNKFNLFFYKTFSFHWVRVSFKGKGYRLRKFRKNYKVTLNFGHSHWTKLLLSESFFFKKMKRQNYVCLIDKYFKYKIFKFYIKFIKRLNAYTKRGLRLKKQFIRKRFGKISQVVSSLH